MTTVSATAIDMTVRGTAWLVAGLLLGIGGCGSPKPPPAPAPTEVNGRIEASESINPSVSRRPSPLLIRVYELRNANAFDSADFVALYQRDQAELAADIVSRDELMLKPGESRPLVRTLSADTRFIAVFGAFRDVEHARWRSVVAVQPNRTYDVVIRADGLSLVATATVAPAAKGKK